MGYEVLIDKFNGPLDLLLHLIKKSEVDIYNINISDITSQYLIYIKEMESLNLNIASSYLVMAFELLELKSSMLLPKQEINVDEYEESPRDSFIRKLVEYQNYKDITPSFKELENSRKECYSKVASDLTAFSVASSLPDDIEITDLISAFSNFLSRAELHKPIATRIVNREYSIEDRSIEIVNFIKGKGSVKFEDLLNNCDNRNKSFMIVTFLATLMLCRSNKVKIFQDDNFGCICISEG